MDNPAVYRIRVRERLGSEWSARLAGMRVTTRDGGDQTCLTDLVGTIQDQAALMGVLDQLYTMGATLVSIERLPEGKSGGRHRA